MLFMMPLYVKLVVGRRWGFAGCHCGVGFLFCLVDVLGNVKYNGILVDYKKAGQFTMCTISFFLT